jgi:NADPH:quinone reductase-like Zn-dependent oxidoreductase
MKPVFKKNEVVVEVPQKQNGLGASDEIVGVVLHVGEAVTAYKVGDKILYFSPELSEQNTNKATRTVKFFGTELLRLDEKGFTIICKIEE